MIPVTVADMLGSPNKPDVLRVHPRDDVLVALRDIQAGETVRSPTDVLTATAPVPPDNASGKLTRAEHNGEREVAIWKTGVTL